MIKGKNITLVGNISFTKNKPGEPRKYKLVIDSTKEKVFIPIKYNELLSVADMAALARSFQYRATVSGTISRSLPSEEADYIFEDVTSIYMTLYIKPDLRGLPEDFIYSDTISAYNTSAIVNPVGADIGDGDTPTITLKTTLTMKHPPVNISDYHSTNFAELDHYLGKNVWLTGVLPLGLRSMYPLVKNETDKTGVWLNVRQLDRLFSYCFDRYTGLRPFPYLFSVAGTLRENVIEDREVKYSYELDDTKYIIVKDQKKLRIRKEYI